MESAAGVSAKFFLSLIKQQADKATEGVQIHVYITKHAQKQLIDLQCLDSIAWQTDRHLGNYFVDYERQEGNTYIIKSIKGIDNDLSFGEKKLSEQRSYRRDAAGDISMEVEDLKNRAEVENDSGNKKYLLRMVEILEDHQNRFSNMAFFNDLYTGKSALAHMSEDMAKNILDLDESILRYTFFDILSNEEIDALVERTEVIKKAIRLSKKNEGFLLKENDWGETSFNKFIDKSTVYNYIKNFVLTLKQIEGVEVFSET